MAEFEASSGANPREAKWGLACALSVIASDDLIEDVMRLLRQPRHGGNRAPLLKILARSTDPEIRSKLEEFSNDRELARDVEVLLRKRRRARAQSNGSDHTASKERSERIEQEMEEFFKALGQ